jgi:hypothetical protein
MNTSVRNSLVIRPFLLLAIILLVLLMPARTEAQARVPMGIYAVVPVEQVVNAEFAVAKSEGKGITIAGMDLYLTSDFYPGLLDNPAVSGLALQIHWDTLNPNPPDDADAYFWNYVDDAFSSVGTWNSKHPKATPKTIQLIVSPGFNSPQWVRDQLTSCDGLFDPTVLLPTPASSCGLATFTTFPEDKLADSHVLPMPWNLTYQEDWYTFLTALSARYNTNTAFVSIAVAGPTGASAEMLLPHGTTKDEMFSTAAYSANDMWKQLLSNEGSPETDQLFIDFWGDAIYATGGIFTGLTIVVTTGDGLPNLSNIGPFTPPAPFGPDCTSNEDMDCQAETRILSYFVQPYVAPSDAKATQTSGMEASRVDLDLGIDGVKFLSQLSEGFPQQTLGGAQFNEAFSVSPKKEGSNSEFPTPTKDQALFNVLQVFFTGTSVAGDYCEPKAVTPAPLNYLQIYYQDIQYAASHGSATVIEKSVAEGTCATVTISAQDQLNKASKHLFAIAEP